MDPALQTLIFAGIYTLLVFHLTRSYSDIKCREQVHQARRGIKDSSTSVRSDSTSGDLKPASPRFGIQSKALV